MKKYLISPLFAPIFFSWIWLLVACYVLTLQYDNIDQMLAKGGLVEVVTHSSYIVLLVTFLLLLKFFRQKSCSQQIDFALFFVLGVAAFLRELGIQHWIPSKDTTAFKSRFFLNPENPLDEKLLAGFLLLALLAVVVYLGTKYAKYLITSFFKMNPISWSVATLCTVGVVSKFVDRFPSNYRKSHGGIALPEQLDWNLEFLEESSEVLLPWIAAFCLWQYWLICKNKQN